jgi:hypothetical protein
MNCGVWDIMKTWHENAGMILMVLGGLFVLNEVLGNSSILLLLPHSD